MAYDEKSFSQGIATKQLKVQNPDDPTEIIQIGLIDTGATTALGEKIFSLDVSGSTLSIIAATALKPDGYSHETIVPAGTPTALAVTTKAVSVVIQADNANTVDGKVLNITLTAGETIVIETVPDASWIIVDGLAGASFDITVLTNSTI